MQEPGVSKLVSVRLGAEEELSSVPANTRRSEDWQWCNGPFPKVIILHNTRRVPAEPKLCFVFLRLTKRSPPRTIGKSFLSRGETFANAHRKPSSKTCSCTRGVRCEIYMRWAIFCCW